MSIFRDTLSVCVCGIMWTILICIISILTRLRTRSGYIYSWIYYTTNSVIVQCIFINARGNSFLFCSFNFSLCVSLVFFGFLLIHVQINSRTEIHVCICCCAATEIVFQRVCERENLRRYLHYGRHRRCVSSLSPSSSINRCVQFDTSHCINQHTYSALSRAYD